MRTGTIDDVGGARVAAALSASRATSDFTYLDPVASSAAGHDVSQALRNAGHAAANGLTSVAVPIPMASGEGALSVTGLAQARHQDLPGTVLGPTPLAHLDLDRELLSAELSGPVAAGALRVRGWGRREGTRLGDALGSSALGPTYAAQTDVASGGSVGYGGAIGAPMTVEAAVDAAVEAYEPGLYVGAPSPPHATRTSGGAGVDVAFRPRDAMDVTASGRLDAWVDDATDGVRDSELRPTGHLGIEAPLGVVTLAAHGGATAHPPSFVERYGDRGAFVGDPSLRPESAWTADAGARAVQRVGLGRIGLEAVFFGTWADDLITFVPAGAYGRAKATNIGRARIAGVELDARAAIGPLEVRASYTGLATENDAACAAMVGPCVRPPLPGRPAHDLVADAIARFGPATARIGVDALTGMFADTAQNLAVPPRVLASAGVRVDAAPGLRFALEVRNLFDVRSGTYAGSMGPVREPIGDYYEYPLPGRAVLVSARFGSQAAP
jgi:hypothetical protein